MYILKKINKINSIFVLTLSLSIVVLTSKAQEFTNDEKLMTAYQASIDSLLLIGPTISMEDAKQTLGSVQDPVALKLVKSSSKQLKVPELYERAKQATTIVGIAYLCPRCSNVHLSESSGYIIDSNGIMVTNYHVAAMYANMKDGNKPVGFFARLADGRTYGIKAILNSSKNDDLAILQLDSDGAKLPAIQLAAGPKVGEQIFVLGHPKGMHYFFTQGYVNNRYLEEAGEPNNKFFREMLVISADYATGSSGGPVLDIYGNVVGTVSNTKTLMHSDMNPSVQMVLKNSVPVESLYKLISKSN